MIEYTHYYEHVIVPTRDECDEFVEIADAGKALLAESEKYLKKQQEKIKNT